MLINLHIENYLIIEKASIDFTDGLNVITGETGSGKSMIFDAIGLILGDKGSKELIRHGAEKAFLQASFIIDDDRIQEVLSSEGFESEDTLIISRDLYLSGKSIFKVNGRLVTGALVKSLGQYLINLSGQHENQVLMDISHHRQLIDEFGHEALESLILETKASYDKVKKCERELEQYAISDADWQKEVNFLAYQIDEIEKAKLREGEEEALDESYESLKHFEQVQNASNQSLSLIKEDRGLLAQLSKLRRTLSEAVPYNKMLNEPFQQVETAYYALENAAEDLRNISESLDFDEEKLVQIENRLSLINELKRKYGKSLKDILDNYSTLQERHDFLIHFESKKNELSMALEESKGQYFANAKALSERRKQFALNFESALGEELKDLNFNQCDFKAVFEESSDIQSHGIDQVEFYLSANPGEPLRPLRKIASGGELSRIMLAVKLINRSGDYASTQIFDEIDSGISGRTANAVANKLKLISESGQIILVTHLPQIAVQGRHHLLIEKIVVSGSTKVNLLKMSFEERVLEIARMIGSGEMTELTKLSAREMLLAAGLKNMEV